jgi:hypothetical protein
MVHYRPDPRGINPKQFVRWTSTLGPFNSQFFQYNKYRYMDWAVKHPRLCIGYTLLAGGALWFNWNFASLYYGTNPRNARLLNHAERPFEYAFYAKSRLGTRGTWDNTHSEI